MTDRQPSAYTRREFLSTGLALASASLTIPAFLNSSAFGLPRNWWGGNSIPGVPDGRILVVIQLSGGNDGLNTVVPYTEAAYYKARPAIGIPEARALKLGKTGVGLHPAMAAMADLYNDGVMSVVQGVGYPNPNRSHFKSMDIWHTAETSATGDGWIGRYFDAECCGSGKGESGTAEKKDPDPQAGIAIGREAPLAMRGRMVTPLSFESADLFRWTGKDVNKDLATPYDALTRRPVTDQGEGNAAFLTRTALDAQVSSDTIRRAVAARPRVAYPQSDLARQLQMVASMIHAKLSTRVYYVSMGGYDTHAGQGGEQGRHSQLLGQFAQAVKAFLADLKAQGNDSRVLTMSFSEFGRRVGQNASNGTDHGTAAPMFLFGPMVKPGVLTEHPSLTDLDQGDLRFTTDFRTVYAGVLEGWMKADSKKILSGSHRAMPVIAKG